MRLTARRPVALQLSGDDRLGPSCRRAFGGIYIVNECFNNGLAEQITAAGEADAVARTARHSSRSDLVRRLREDAALNNWATATFYTPGPEGYVAYPALT